MLSSNSSTEQEVGICLYIKERSDNYSELALRAYGKDFLVCGAAFFVNTALKEFLRSLRIYPLDKKNFPSISGGFYDNEGKELLREHFHMSIRQIDNRGLLVMNIRAFTPYEQYLEEGIGCGGRSSYFFHYAELEIFSIEFEKLISGKTDRFEFKEFLQL